MANFGSIVEGSGHVITETRPVAEFHGVALALFGTLILKQGEAVQLEVEGEDNILAEIKTEVEDGRLIITRRNPLQLRPTQTPVYRLTVRELDQLSLSGSGLIEAESLQFPRLGLSLNGSGDIVLAQLTTEWLAISSNGSGAIRLPQVATSSVEVSLNGSGSVTLAGRTVQQGLTLSGSGRYIAGDLDSQEARVQINGSGGAVVQVQTTLSAQLNSSGSVHYIGHPTVTQQRFGSGSVLRQALPHGAATAQLPTRTADDES